MGKYISKNILNFRQNNITKLNEDLVTETAQVLKSCDIIADTWLVSLLWTNKFVSVELFKKWNHKGIRKSCANEQKQLKLSRTFRRTEDLGRCVDVFGLPWWLSSTESACSAGDTGSIPELGRSPGGGHDNSFQYSCLENPMGQRSLEGYIQVHGVTKSQT